MAITITEQQKYDYMEGLRFVAQQAEARLMPYVTPVSLKGEATSFDRIGKATGLSQVTTRFPTTPHNDSAYDRRWMIRESWHTAEKIDNEDQINMMSDPSSYAVQAKIMELKRRKDQTIINNIAASVQQGKTPGASSAATLGVGQQIAVDYVYNVSATNTGMTVDKIIRAGQIFNANDVMDGDLRVLVMGPQQLTDLMHDERFTSKDFVNDHKFEVENGSMAIPFYGFNLLVHNLLPVNADTDVTTCYAWAKSGVFFGTAKETEIKYSERDDLSYTPQFYLRASFGAMRHDEEKVVQILADNSP